MKLRRTIASFCLLGLFVCFGSASKAASMYGKVIEIVDGDSIVIESFNRPVKIELMGIDAPELKQNYGDVARQHLLDLVFDKTVTVEYFGLGEDGSIAGKVFLNRIDVAAQMVRDGVAWYDKGNANRLSETERQVYTDSEQAARNEQRGIWQESKPLAPWDFRQNPTIATVTQTPGKAESASSVARPVRSLSNDDLGLERFSQSSMKGIVKHRLHHSDHCLAISPGVTRSATSWGTRRKPPHPTRSCSPRLKAIIRLSNVRKRRCAPAGRS